MLCGLFLQGQSPESRDSLEWLVLDLQFEEFMNVRQEYPGSISCYAESEMYFLRAFIDNTPEARSEYLKHFAQLTDSDRWSELNVLDRSALDLEKAVIQSRNGESISAAWNAYRALRGFQSEAKMQSESPRARAYWGLSLSLISFLPEEEQRYARWIGLYGDPSMGLEMMGDALDKMVQTMAETARLRFLYYMMLLQAGKKDLIDRNALGEHFPDQFVKLQLLGAEKASRAEISLLKEMIGVQGRFPLPYLYYQLGKIEIRSGFREGRSRMEYFLREQKGIEYKASAYYFLLLDRRIHGDLKPVDRYKKEILSLPTSGVGDDQLARREVLDKIPTDLLRLRFALDIGDGSGAMDLLELVDSSELITDRDKEEFLYRRARWLEMMERREEAIQDYETIVRNDHGTDHYYFPNSCLRLAVLYADMNDISVEEIHEIIFQGLSYPEPYPYSASIRNKLQMLLESMTGGE